MAEASVYQCACGQMAQACGSVNGYPGLECKACNTKWWHTSCWKCKESIDGRKAQECSKCKYWFCPACGVCSRRCAIDRVKAEEE